MLALDGFNIHCEIVISNMTLGIKEMAIRRERAKVGLTEIKARTRVEVDSAVVVYIFPGILGPLVTLYL